MLKLNDAEKAQIYGVPAGDGTRASVRAELAAAHPNWTPAEVDNHLDAAIHAGVYVEDDEVKEHEPD